MEILTVLGAIWRRKLVVVASLVIFLAVAVVMTLLIPKQYEAEALMQVTSADSSTSLLNELGMSEMAMTLTTGDEDMQDKIFVALAPPVMDEVIWRLQLRDSDGNLLKYDDVNAISIIGPLLGKPGFELTQEQGTSVLHVMAAGPSKEAAALMADTLADVYTHQTTEIARADTREAQRFIIEQVALVQTELDRIYTEKAEAQSRNDVIDMEQELKSAVQRISDLMLEYQMVTAKIEETRGRLGEVKRFRVRELDAGGSPTAMQADPIIHDMTSKVRTLYKEREKLTRRGFTDKAPEIVELTAEIGAYEQSIGIELAKLQDLDPEVHDLETELSGLRKRAAEIESLADRTTTEFATYPARMREVAKYDLAASAAEAVYKALEDQRYQIGVAEAMTMSDTRILSRAKAPDKHSSPSVILNLLGGIFLGLGFGVAGALVLEYVDDTLHDADAVRKSWDLPQLGVVVKYNHKGAMPAVATLPATDPIAEAYRTIRNSLEFASLDKAIQILGFTSSIPGEGKSTTAINVAISLAREGKRVLMVDGDLRLPTQHRQFATTVVAPGLVELLTRSATPEEAIQPTGVENLDMLAAGTSPPDPGNLVESLRMRQVLLELARGYDVVVIDAPPVLAVNDPIVLARVVDAMVLVVECGNVTRRMLGEVRSRFEAAHLAPVGIVLNKMRTSNNLYGAYAKQYQRAAQAREASGGPK
jgi:capsular exopolysaccharide synthesis family protein